jgi:hypothetical protein
MYYSVIEDRLVLAICQKEVIQFYKVKAKIHFCVQCETSRIDSCTT